MKKGRSLHLRVALPAGGPPEVVKERDGDFEEDLEDLEFMAGGLVVGGGIGDQMFCERNTLRTSSYDKKMLNLEASKCQVGKT